MVHADRPRGRRHLLRLGRHRGLHSGAILPNALDSVTSFEQWSVEKLGMIDVSVSQIHFRESHLAFVREAPSETGVAYDTREPFRFKKRLSPHYGEFGEGALLASHVSLGGVEGTLPRVASVRV